MTNLDAFLRWHCGDLLDVRNREAYAEWLVIRALDLDPGVYRAKELDPELCFGPLTLAVASAAWVSAAPQARPTAISFAIEQRRAAVHVFCLLAEEDPACADPQQLSQWLFWVVPSRRLNAERRTIGLQPLIRAHGDGIGYAHVRPAVEALAASP